MFSINTSHFVTSKIFECCIMTSSLSDSLFILLNVPLNWHLHLVLRTWWCILANFCIALAMRKITGKKKDPFSLSVGNCAHDFLSFSFFHVAMVAMQSYFTLLPDFLHSYMIWTPTRTRGSNAKGNAPIYLTFNPWLIQKLFFILLTRWNW